MPKKNTQPKPSPNNGLPEDVKNQILSFKEMFPQYRASTNDDILELFEQFNNNYEEVVYGVMNQLETKKPAEKWQPVGKKKKSKNQNRQRGQNATRGQSSTRGQSARRSDQRYNARTSSRGQSATRAPKRESASNRGRSSNVSNSQSRPQALPSSQNVAPPPVASSNPPVQKSNPSSNPTPKSSNFIEGLSYANVAKSRQPWNPNKPKKEATLPIVEAPLTEQKPVQLDTPSVTSTPEPILQTNTNIPQTSQTMVPPSTSLPQNQNPSTSLPSAQSFSQPQVDISPPQKLPSPIEPQSNNTKEERPRVGVLLPGNFTSDDSMSFQFGKLGILEEDDFGATSTEQEVPKSQAPPSTNQASSNPSRPSNKQSTRGQSTQAPTPKVPQGVPEMDMQGGFPMNPQMQYSMQYPMYPGMEGTDMPRGPMAYYPPTESSFQPGGGYSRDGKAFRGNQSQNYSGRESPSKFPSETPANGNAASQNTPAAQFFGYPMYPYMNQFPGGSYGNQFYPGYPYKGFPGYSQNFPNSMYPGPEEEQQGKQNRSPSGYYSQDSSLGGRDSSKQTSNSGQQQQQQSGTQSNKGQSKSSNPSLEGNFPNPNDPNFKQSQAAQDYYNDYMASPFMTMNPPFYHPGPMGGQTGYPPQSSNQSPNQNRY